MIAPPSIHAAERWRTLSLVEQMGNVGSEVQRAIRAREQNRPDRFDSALARALELFDLTANDPRWRGPRRREILAPEKNSAGSSSIRPSRHRRRQA